MNDPTKPIRKTQVAQINSQVESNDKDTERARLEAIHGQVWDTDEMNKDFDAIGFMAPYIAVKRKSDGAEGALQFQHLPRFYFNFQPS